MDEEIIRDAAIDKPVKATMSVAMETECANAIMDGCAEELLGIRLDNVTPMTRERIQRTLTAIMGDSYREDN